MVRRFFFQHCAFIFFAIVTAILSALSVHDQSFSDAIFLKTGYFFMLGLFVVWVYSFWSLSQSESFRPYVWLYENSVAVATILLLSLGAFYAIGPGYRVLSDETNLIAVSRSMVLDHKIFNTIMGKWYYDNYFPISEELPSRPLFYPFLVSLLHSLSGYRVANAFYTNGLIGFLFLLMVYRAVSLYLGQLLGLVSVFFLFAQPLFGLSMTSGGYELCNVLLMWLLCFLTGVLVNAPSRERFNLWWFTGIVFCHVRYENPLIFAVAALVLVVEWRRIWQVISTSSAAIGLGLFLLLPRLWQMLFAGENYENGDKALLSAFRIPHKLATLIVGMFDFGFFYPYAALVNIAVIVLLLLALYRFKFCMHFMKTRRGMLAGLLALALASLTATLISGSHFLADPLHPATFRLFLPTVLFFSFVGMIGTVGFSSAARVRCFLLGLVGLLIYVPVAARKSSTNTLTLIRATNAVYSYLDSLHDPRVLVIVDRPGQYTVRNNGAVDFGYANQNVDQLLNDANRSLISKILVVQEVQYSDNRPLIALDARFQLNPVWEFQQDANIKVVISQVGMNR